MARYCVLDIDNTYKLEQIAIVYDFKSAANCAEKNNRPDWAKWIQTGRA